MDKKAWYSCQILFSLFLILTGIFIIITSIQFSRPLLQSGSATCLDMPGLSPIVCSALMILLSLYIIVDAAHRGGTLGYFWSAPMRKALKSTEAITLYKVFAAFILYVFILFPSLPYWLSTVVFLVLFMAIFKVFSWKTILISMIVTGALMYVFGVLFAVNLPNKFF